jgi:uncharacterized membrane protein
MIGLIIILSLILAVVLIVVLVRLSEIGSQIRLLEEKLHKLSREIQKATSHTGTTPPVQAHAPGTSKPEAFTAGTETATTVSAILPEPPIPPPEPERLSPPVLPRPARPSRTREEWEALIGGKLLNRIGALALVIGIGFFLKYAFDNNWLSEAVRVLIGAVAGLLLLAGAAQSRKHGLLIFAQGLVGAGIAVLYLSVYASFNYYSLVSQPVAFVLMAIVTVIAFTQAFLYDSIAVSLLGWIGGFLTPFMLSTGEANEIGLFSYIGLLAAGMMIVVMKKEKWTIIEPLTLAATYFIFYLWYGQEYIPADLVPTLFFASIFWALFFLADVANSARQITTLQALRTIASAFNAALFFLALFLLIDRNHHPWMGAATAILGIIYLVTAVAMRSRFTLENTFVRLSLTAIVLVTIAIAIEFTRFTIVIYWSVEAMVLVWYGRQWKLRFLLFSAFALYIVAILDLFNTAGAFFVDPIGGFVPVFNMRAAAFALLAASMGGSALLLAKEVRSSPGGWTLPATATAVRALHYGWCLVLFILLTVETNDLYRLWMSSPSDLGAETLAWHRYLIEAIVWAAFGVAAAWIGRRYSLKPLLVSGTLAVMLAIGLSLIEGPEYLPIERFTLILNIRAVSMLLVIVATFLLGTFLERIKDGGQYSRVASVLHYGGCLLLLVLVTTEAADFFNHMKLHTPAADLTMLLFRRYMTYGAVWALLAVGLAVAAGRLKLKPLLYSAILVMFLGMGMAAIRGIAFDPVERFDLAFNFRTLTILLVIAAMFAMRAMLKRMKEFNVSKEIAETIRTFTVVLILVLLTGETRDFFEKKLELLGPLQGNMALSASDLENMKQLSLSGVWLLYSISLMGVGIWRRLRSLRVIAFVLFGVTILKIFIYDLSFLETLYRIFSFIGLGVVLLIVSYLYQHYKGVIFQKQTEEEVDPGESIA